MATPNLIGTPGAAGTASSLTQKLIASMQLASGANTVYTVPADCAAKIATAALCNTSASSVVVSVSVVPVGGTVDSTHRVVSGYPLAAGDTLDLDSLRGLMLGPGDFISVN